MKKFVKVVMSGALVAAMGCTLAAGLVGCGGEESEELNITGSTSVQPLMEKLAAAYEETNENVTINVSGGGSGVGVEDAAAGKVDFGMASRELKDDEKATVKGQAIALDGIALIVNKDSTLTSVTKAQVKALYENGTAIDSIVAALSREDGSGTRSAFEEIIGIKSLYNGQGFEEISSTGTVKTNIAGNKAANTIGYISLGSLDDSVKAVKFEGVEATVENIKNGTYTLSRPFNIVYKEGSLSETAQDFIDFIMSEDGQAIVTSEGYITVS